MRVLLPLCFLVSTVFAAGIEQRQRAIGVVTASGHFIVERAEVWGNATLTDGATIETRAASSEVSLNGGARVHLAANSRARVWRDHLVLERGVSQATGGYRVEALGLRITGESRTRVGLSGGSRVEVAALNGPARVLNGKGGVLAAIPAGREMVFEPQAAAAVTRSGCLVYKNGSFLLQDESSSEVVELTGGDTRRHTGNRVQVTGTMLAAAKPNIADAKSVMSVSSITERARGGCLSVASALNAQTTAPLTTPTAQTMPPPAPTSGGGGGGMSTGAKVGIAVAAAGGGIGAILALSGKNSTSP